MIKKIAKKLALFMCVALTLMPVVVYASSTKDQLDDAKNKEKELKKKIEAVQATIDALKSDIANTEKYIQSLDEEMDKISLDIADLNIQIDNKNDEIAVTTQKLHEAENTEKEQYEAMKLRIKYMYENNNKGYFELLMTSASLSDLLNQAEYVSHVTKYDRDKLDEYVATKEQIAANKVQLEAEEADLEDLMSELEAEQESVQLLLDAKTEQMNQYIADSKAYAAKQKEMEKDMDNLDALISKLTSQYNAEQLAKANAVATQANLYSKQLLIWPSPSCRTISSHFSPNRLDPVLGYVRAHKGTDIAASYGSAVVAAASGLVTAAGYSDSMGNYIVISHGDGITTRYYHNSALVVSAGQSVTAGQTISYVGSTGWTTGPHLHFEVRVNDTPVDPMQFF